MATVAVSTNVHDTQDSQQSEPRQDLPRPYKCPLCDKAFHRLEHQTRHIRTHTGEKPHACQFPGCQKRFSRSDELTRHSRIHSNPNSRRGKAANNAHAALTFAPGHPEAVMGGPYMMAAPQPIQYPATAPSSHLGSPNVSPPHSYVQYHAPGSYHTPPSYGSLTKSGYDSPLHTLNQPPERGINLLATAASQVEVERQSQGAAVPPSSYHPQRIARHHSHHHHHPYSSSNSPANSRVGSLSAYAYSSNSMSRSNSAEGHPHGPHSGHLEDPYANTYGKRDRPPSPQYTNPASPNHSACESCSDTHTSGHTPAITPAHSPRLRPMDIGGVVQLPGIRSLTLQQGHVQNSGPKFGVPDTLEPTADVNNNTSHTNSINSSYAAGAASAPASRRASINNSPPLLTAIHHGNSVGGSRSNSGMRISDIVHSDATGGKGRTLPVPTMSASQSGTSTPHGGSRSSVHWMLNAEDDDPDRMDES